MLSELLIRLLHRRLRYAVRHSIQRVRHTRRRVAVPAQWAQLLSVQRIDGSCTHSGWLGGRSGSNFPGSGLGPVPKVQSGRGTRTILYPLTCTGLLDQEDCATLAGLLSRTLWYSIIAK